MPRKKKIKFKAWEMVTGTPEERAKIILRNYDDDLEQAMGYCAATGDREALEVINPFVPGGSL